MLSQFDYYHKIFARIFTEITCPATQQVDKKKSRGQVKLAHSISFFPLYFSPHSSYFSLLNLPSFILFDNPPPRSFVSLLFSFTFFFETILLCASHYSVLFFHVLCMSMEHSLLLPSPTYPNLKQRLVLIMKEIAVKQHRQHRNNTCPDRLVLMLSLQKVACVGVLSLHSALRC